MSEASKVEAVTADQPVEKPVETAAGRSRVAGNSRTGAISR